MRREGQNLQPIPPNLIRLIWIVAELRDGDNRAGAVPMAKLWTEPAPPPAHEALE